VIEPLPANSPGRAQNLVSRAFFFFLTQILGKFCSLNEVGPHP